MPEYRVNRTTVNLGRSAAYEQLQEALCLLGTRHCLGGTVLCRFPTIGGCCGRVWSNPGGPAPGSIACWHGTDLTDCRLGTDLTIPTRPTCGLNYSTCPGASVFRTDDFVGTIQIVEGLQEDLAKAAEELKEQLPELQRAFEPGELDELAEAEEELKAALQRVQELRERKG